MKSLIPNTQIPAHTLDNEVFVFNIRTAKTNRGKLYTTCKVYGAGLFITDLLIMGGRVNPPSVKLGQTYQLHVRATKEMCEKIYRTLIEGLREENIYTPLMGFEEAMGGWFVDESELL